jgi:hypothetical protein
MSLFVNVAMEDKWKKCYLVTASGVNGAAGGVGFMKKKDDVHGVAFRELNTERLNW